MTPTPSPPRDTQARAVLARWQQWFHEAQQALQEEARAIAQERQALGETLKDFGLDTPEAIHAAWRDMDASERQALQRQVGGEGAHVPAPAAAPRRSRRGGFI